MKTFKIKSVTLEGYGPFKKKTSYPLSDRGVVLVRGENRDDGGSGSNGAGKTTLLMAALWALRGESDPRPEGTSKRGLKSELVNDKSKNGSVTLDVELNGEPVTITRSMGSKGHKLKVVVGDHDRTCQDVALTQKVIDEMVIDTGLLVRSMFLCQRDASGLLEMTDKGRKEILGKFVNLSIWAAAAEEASSLHAKEKADAESFIGKMEAYDKQIEMLDASIERHEKGLSEWSADRKGRIDRLQKAVEEVQSKLDSHANDRQRGILEKVSALKESLGRMDSSEVRARIVMHREEVAVWRHRLREVEGSGVDAATLECANAALSTAKVEEAKVAAIGSRVKDEADQYIKKFESAQAECPECKQPVSVEHARSCYDKMMLEVDALRERYVELRAKKLQAQGLADGERTKYEAASSQMAAELQNINTSMMSASSALSAAESELSAMKMKYESIEAEIASVMQTSNVENPWSGQLAAAQSRLDEVVSSNDNPHKEAVDTLSASRDDLEKLKHEAAVAHEESLYRASEYQDCKNIFGRQGIQSYVLETALSDLGERIDGYLNELSAGHLSLGVSAISEKKSGGFSEKMSFNPMVRTKDGTMVSRKYRQLSGGQQRRMALSVALAFADFSCSRSGVVPNVLILDEVLQFLDGEGRRRVLDILHSLERESVMLVSHDGELAGSFDVVDTVILEDDVARVEVG